MFAKMLTLKRPELPCNKPDYPEDHPTPNNKKAKPNGETT